MNKNSKYVLVVVMILAILYLLYRNSSESYSTCARRNQPDTHDSVTMHQNDETKSSASKKLVVHHTTWCGYSRQHLNQMKQGLEKKLNDVGVKVEYIDCDKDKEACVRAGVRGYPTLILHTEKGAVRYNGNRSEQDLLNFVKSN